MQRYGISVREIFKRTVIVKGDGLKDAIQKVEAAIESDKLLLEMDDYDTREIVPSEYWKGGIIPENEDVSFYYFLDNNEAGQP